MYHHLVISAKVQTYVAFRYDDEVNRSTSLFLNIDEVFPTLREHLVPSPARAHDDELEVLWFCDFIWMDIKG